MSLSLRLHHADHAPYWLVGNPLVDENDRTQVLTESWQIGRQQQAMGGAAWFSRQFFDRQNQSVSFEATTLIEFKHPWEQLDFIARLAPENEEEQAHEWDGDVYLRHTLGQDWREWPMREATVMLAATEIVGDVSLRLRYRIQASGLGRGVTGRVVMGSLGFYGTSSPASFHVTGAELDDIVTLYGMEPGDRMEMVVSRAGDEPVVRSCQISAPEPPPVGEIWLPLSSWIWYVWHTVDMEQPGLITFTPEPAVEWTVTTVQVGVEAFLSLRFYRVTEEGDVLVHAIEAAGAAGPFTYITTPAGERITAMIS